MISERQEDCSECGLPDISKLLTKPLYFDKKVKKNATGEVTKKYIDDNKRILEDMKKEVKGETYD